MSHSEISSDEPASKKARISPSSIMTPRESFDDMNFENNLNDLLPDELGGFNASTSFESNGSASNGPSSQAVNGNEMSFPNTSLQNGPSAPSSQQNSFSNSMSSQSESSFIHNSNSQPGVTVTSAPINGSQQFGGPGTPGNYPNPPPPSSIVSSNSVLHDLLLSGQAGPRSVPSSSVHLTASPQRPPTAPNGGGPAQFTRSPSVNNVLSPPNMLQRHPSGGAIGRSNDGFSGGNSVTVTMASNPGYNGTSIVASTGYHANPMYSSSGGGMSMVSRMPNGTPAGIATMSRSSPGMMNGPPAGTMGPMGMRMGAMRHGPIGPGQPINRMPMNQGPGGGFPGDGGYTNGPVNPNLPTRMPGSREAAFMDQQVPPAMIPQSPNFGNPGTNQRMPSYSPMPPQMNGPSNPGGMIMEPSSTNMVGPPNVSLPRGGGGGGGPPSQCPPQFCPTGTNPPSMPSVNADQVPVGHPGSGGTPGSAQDPEKRKLIQQQLVLLLHAHKCQQREKDLPNGQRNQCSLPHCSTMKSVLAHMTTCSTGRACSFAHCASSRQIIQHWKNCHRQDCPVCLPLKNIAVDGKNKGATGQTDGNINLLIGLAEGRPPPPPPPANSRPGFSPGGAGIGKGADMATALGRGPPPGQFPGPPSVGGDAGAGGHAVGLPPMFQDFRPESTELNKDWHKTVTPDLRNHLVGKLVKAIFPSPDPAAIHDQRIKDLIAYAKKVEKEMFECANDREEYYHLLAEKIYKIQKELQEKKRDREKGGLVGPRAGSFGPGSTGQPPGGPSNLSGVLDMEAPPNRTIRPEFSNRPGMNVASGNMLNMSGPNSNQNINTIKAELETRQNFAGNATVKMEEGTFPVKKEIEEGSMDGGMRIKQEPSTSAGKQTQDIKPDVKPSTSTALVASGAKQPKVFAPDELRNALMPVWEQLESMDEAIPFRVPVDPELLQIPDYFDIIKQPMDLSTIKEKLNTGEYKNPLQFCEDMWLMFDNAWVYNRKNSKVYKYCTKLSDCFTDMIDPVMRRLGYCCGERRPFTPLALFCYGQAMCTIARDQNYYCYETSSTQYGVTVSEKYTYCPKCFETLPNNINLSDDPNSTKNLVPKEDFKLMTNNGIDYETYLDCQDCGIKWHQICALHNDKVYPGGFLCDSCRKEKSRQKPENRFTARRLPHCKLSKHIEDRVNRFLSMKLAAEFPVREQDRKVLIRVLASSDKEVDVKPMMKHRFCSAQNGDKAMADKFPYRTKAIFAFEVIDGVEVCFFGLHVQEYGSNSPAPNARRVYVAYLDSVYYFQPRDMRTDVYHQILLGYLEYVKQLGYTMAHIWACPPSEGDDYIFHCHPPEQKIPKPKRLQEWYKKMLDKGIIERTVTDYKDIYKQANDEQLSSPIELPYFEGDFWPNVLEDNIREVDAEEAQRKREAEAQAQADAMDDLDDETFEVSGGKGKKKNSKGQKKKASNKKASIKKGKKVGSGTGNELMDKLYTMMEKHKEVFFVIRLHTVQSAANLGPINDPDPLIQSELMDGRDTFLSRAREDHWEFSSLRRAKYSTMCLSHALHEGKDLVVYTCNSCKNTNAKWHCSTCDDYDLCQSCYDKSTHEHEMEQIKQLIGEEYGGSDQNKQDNRNESIKRCIQSLVHACGCRDANCKRMSCHKMKRVVGHTKVCKKRQQGSCPVCKQLIALCCYHAKHCKETMCQVPFCQNIRQKLDEQRNIQRRMQDRIMARRINNMYGPTTAQPPGIPPPGSQPSPTVTVNQQIPQQNQMGPRMGSVPYTAQQSPYGQSGPPGAAVVAARQVLAASSQGGMVPPAYRGPDPGMRMRGQSPGQMVGQSQVPWDAGGMQGGGGSLPRVNGPGQMMQRVQSFPSATRMAQPGAAAPRNANDPEDRRRLMHISHRLKAATTETERSVIIAEMKKDPYLLSQVITMSKACRTGPGPGPNGNAQFPNRQPMPMNQSQAQPPGRQPGTPGQFLEAQRVQVNRFPVSQQQQQQFQSQQPSQVYQHGNMNFGQQQGTGMGAAHPLNQVRSPPGGAQVRSPLPNQFLAGGGMGGPEGGPGQPNPSPDSRQPPVMYSR